MDFSQLLPFLQQQPQQPPPLQPGQPTSSEPGAPMNIVPPTGILNGQPPPPTQQQQNGQQMMMQSAQKLMAPPAAPPQMSQLQMAKPLGSQGIDPTKLLAAMKQNQLMSG